jgi:5-methylcytosine-specific restriction endonuclease McrA
VEGFVSWGDSRKRAKLRKALRKRDGRDCHICGGLMLFGRSVDDPDYATIDHVTPRSHGGGHDLSNLKLAHRRCNLARADAAL